MKRLYPLLVAIPLAAFFIAVINLSLFKPADTSASLSSLKKANHDLAAACYQQGVAYGGLKEVAEMNERMGVHMSDKVKQTLAAGPTEGCRP